MNAEQSTRFRTLLNKFWHCGGQCGQVRNSIDQMARQHNIPVLSNWMMASMEWLDEHVPVAGRDPKPDGGKVKYKGVRRG